VDEIESIRKRFCTRGGPVAIAAGEGGLARIEVTTPAATAHVYLHGAHVTQFRPAGQPDVLFLSCRSQFAAGKAIRGGVPVIFPWFASNLPAAGAPAHGFARTATWSVRAVEQAGARVSVSLALAAAPGGPASAWWPHACEAVYTISVGSELELALDVVNTGSAAFTFEEALHTYLAVGDVRQVGIDGLGGCRYIDKVEGGRVEVQASGALRLTGPTDRVYLDSRNVVRVRDAAGRRELTVAKEGSATTIVWNPWQEKAAALPDLDSGEWPRMVCVESGNAHDNAVRLPPGARHQLVVRIASREEAAG
jgi:glucose-6-phosphate 1-epimerase